MKTYTQEELNKILRLHKDWLGGIKSGKRADLRRAVLRSADLSGADLRDAVLRDADLRDAVLRDADLSGADLSDAVLRSAVLIGADLSGAVLRRAVLIDADLSGADLSDADLRDADLSGADLSGAVLIDAVLRRAVLRSADLIDADLSGADLSDAVLRDADLRRADLSDAVLRSAVLRSADLSGARYNETTAFFALQCPEEGDFIGWKKCRNNVIVKLLITGKRSSATSRKCRCSEAKVLEVIGAKEGVSQHDSSFIYCAGETVRVENFDENRWNECSTGIHFFITKAEAENYC